MRDEGATRKNSERWLAGATTLLWGLLIGFGIACRFIGLNWDEGAHLHPDERFLTLTIAELNWPRSAGQYFHTASSPLNPFNVPDVNLFVYGQLPLMLAKAVANWRGQDDYYGLLATGRFLSALFDTATVGLIYFCARRLAGRNGARLAAALLAFTALHLQHAHFFVVDTFAACFVLLSFAFLLKWQQAASVNSSSKVLWPASCCGLAWGLALACKISALLWLFPLVLFVLWQGVRVWERQLSAQWWVFGTLVCCFATFYGFRLAHPMAFLGEPSPYNLAGLLDVRLSPPFWESLVHQQQITSGQAELPFNMQWIGRVDYLWPLQNLGNWGVGWPLLLSACVAIFWLGWRVARHQDVSVALVIAAFWMLAVFFYHGAQFSKFTRYYLLITPFAALLAAWFAAQCWRSARQPHKKYFSALFSGILLSWTVCWGAAVASIYTQPQPRLEATRWMGANIIPGTAIANESIWDDALPWETQAFWRALDLKLYEADDEQKRQHLLQVLNETQWIVVSSPRVWRSVPRWPTRWPLTTAYYHALFSGKLGFVAEREWALYPELNVFGKRLTFPDDMVEEALTVYDHPRVVLFHKTPYYSAETVAKQLPSSLLVSRQEQTLTQLIESGWRPDESTLPRLPQVNLTNP